MDQTPEDTSVDYDIIIAGAGMVGSMLGAALAATPGAHRLRVAILEADRPRQFTSHDPYDLRVSALSIASQNMLKAVGAWQGIAERRHAPFRFMQVWDGEGGGSTRFDSADVGHSHLGSIVENRVIQLALHDSIERLDSVQIISPERLQSAQFNSRSVDVALESGKTLRTRCLVGADGANSKVRELAGIEVQRSQYPQKALVATVTTAHAQQDITWQRFLPTGPQAFLPLVGNRASMVWYHSAEEIDRLGELPEDAFLQLMEEEFPPELGRLESLEARGSFPLFKSHALRYVGDRVALIGDAAHTVHPLAGQGVNLGMLDAAVLAESMGLAITRGADSRRGVDIGHRRHLRPYERWRRTENTVMINVLDGFYQAFKPRARPLQQIRSLALDTVQRFPPLRHSLMQYAMGVKGDLPKLAVAPASLDVSQ